MTIQIEHYEFDCLSVLSPPNPEKTVLILGGLASSAYVTSHKTCSSNIQQGWWEYIVGPGRAVNTNAYRVISLSYTSLIPRIEQRGIVKSLQQLSIVHIASEITSLLEKWGVEVDILIGTSMGATVAYELISSGSLLPKRHISVSGSMHALRSVAWFRGIVRELLQISECCNINQANAVRLSEIAMGLRLWGYRDGLTWERYTERRHLSMEDSFKKHSVDPNFYRFYAILSNALDQYDGGTWCAGKLKEMTALVLSAESDPFYPLKQQKDLAEKLKKHGVIVKHLVVEGAIDGHDSFLSQQEIFANYIAKYLEEGIYYV